LKKYCPKNFPENLTGWLARKFLGIGDWGSGIGDRGLEKNYLGIEKEIPPGPNTVFQRKDRKTTLKASKNG